MTRRLTLLPGTLAVCRLDPADAIPDWAREGSIVSITRTPRELSIVCDATGVPPGVRCETGWRALEVDGPIPFTATGVVASLAGPLAAARIGLFVLSTYDTDYLLVKDDDLETAARVLRDAGHAVTGVVR